MQKIDIPQRLEAITDELAEVEHERWAHWQKHMHSKGKRQADGSLILPAASVQRWERQIDTPYAALTESEKESDRDQVRKYLPLIVRALSD